MRPWGGSCSRDGWGAASQELLRELCGGEDKGLTSWCCLGPLSFQPLLGGLTSQAACSADALLSRLPPAQGDDISQSLPWLGLVPFSPRWFPRDLREARPNGAEKPAEGGDSVTGHRQPPLVATQDLSTHSLLCPAEYDVAAAQEKDRQAFKPTDILRTQKTNCDGYAGLFEKMCRYSGVPRKAGGPGLTTATPPSLLPFQSASHTFKAHKRSLQTLLWNRSES